MDRLGRYEIVELIGSGSMGLVYRGRDPRINRPVALKVIRENVDNAKANRLAAIDRLHAEAQAAGRLLHPGVVTIFDVGEERNDEGVTLFIAMEYIDGLDLERHLRKKTFTDLATKVAFIRQLGAALEYAHGEGVVHRDLKPSNVIVTRAGKPKLTDFGLARAPDAGTTLSGAVFGTPNYMAPEQVRGEDVDLRADVFALTVILYEMITGRKPFHGPDIGATMKNVLEATPTPPSRIVPGLPPLIDLLMERGLAKNRDDRIAGCGELVRLLEEIDFDGDRGRPSPPLAAGEERSLADLVDRYKDRLAGLRERYPAVTLMIEERELACGLATTLGGAGFRVEAEEAGRTMNLAKLLVARLKKGELVLLQYTPKVKGYTLVDLLRGVKRFDRGCPIEGLAPIFVAPTRSYEQQMVFRFLGALGVPFALFLSPESTPAARLEETLINMVSFKDLLAFSFNIDEPSPEKGPDQTKQRLERYQELLRIGRELAEKKRHEEAIRVFTEALSLKPEPDLLIDRGDAYYKTSHFVAALNDYREASRLEKNAADPYARIGGCCLSLAREAAEGERPEQAREWLTAGIKRLEEAERITEKLVADNVDAPERMADEPYGPLLSTLKEGAGYRFDPAIGGERLTAFLERTLAATAGLDDDLSGADTDTLLDRAGLLGVVGRYEEAERIYRKRLPRDPEPVASEFNNYAVGLRKRGEFGRAFDIYHEILRYDIRDLPIVLKNMQMAGTQRATELRNGFRFAEAAEVYELILTYDIPERGWVMLELAQTCLENNERGRAADAVRDALATDPAITSSAPFARFRSLLSLVESPE
jgi:tetratricopeptide (TPR) repeat protein